MTLADVSEVALEQAVASLRETELPQAQQAVPYLPAKVAQQLTALAEEVQSVDASQLQTEHRRVYTHILSLDCPPCETLYTARHLFQETQELSDIAGFFRAFGLELAERERPDHISVELEFMYFLTYKEAYALQHHGRAKARLCREAQRKFMQDHLGRWAFQFARRLKEKAQGGYFGCLASLTEAFLSAEVGLLRTQPEAVTVDPQWRVAAPEDEGCPAAEECPLVELGSNHAHAQ